MVTTNVQFFEPLFSHRSSQCRRLHRIAKSVVILDEAQMLPVDFLKPCLEVVKELSATYRTTMVLCTATQPALSKRDDFKMGLDNVREIIPEPEKLYAQLKRVEIKHCGQLDDDALVCELKKHAQVLCIVNTRGNARRIFEKIRHDKGSHHLSALMCPEHRSQKFKDIKAILKQPSEKVCRVISTQLIEAGVDIDFPVVFREMAGVDSIAQAAGRCNREGRLEKGKVYTFCSEKQLKSGNPLRQAADMGAEVLRKYPDLLSLEAVEAYFQKLYWSNEDRLDKEGILKLLGLEGGRRNPKFPFSFPFREVSQKFKLIKNETHPIIIPWNEEAEELIQQLRYSPYPASIARKLQRFTVQVYAKDLNELEGVAVERVREAYCVLTNKDIYDEDLGLCPEEPTLHKSMGLMV